MKRKFEVSALTDDQSVMLDDILDINAFAIHSSQISSNSIGGYHCHYCGKQYKREGNLKKHMVSYHDAANNTCQNAEVKNREETLTELRNNLEKVIVEQELAKSELIKSKNLNDYLNELLQNQIKKVTEDLEKVTLEKDRELQSVQSELVKFKKLYFIARHGEPKLHHAVEENDEHLVQELIDNGENVNVPSGNLEIPLHRSRLGITKDIGVSIRMIDTLLIRGANPFAKDKWGNTSLHKMVTTVTSSQFHDVATCLIGNNLAKLFDIPDGRDGATPFQLAVRHIEVEAETLAALHKSGIDFNAADTRYGLSLLAYAIQGARSNSLISNLIKFGADVKQLNLENQSMLHIAAKNFHYESLKLFLERGLNINGLDKNGDTPLHLVMQSKIENMCRTLQLLIDEGATTNIQNKDMRTPLHLASLNVATGIIVEVVKILFECRKTTMRNAFAEDQDKRTFMDYLVRKRPKLTPSQFHELVDYLVMRKGFGKLFHIRNKVCGLTPLEVAAKNIYVEKKTLACLAGNHSIHINSEYEYSEVSDGDF